MDEVLPYGGKPQRFPQWEHDMSLREAFRLSAVPIYQTLARRIGLPKMTKSVSVIAYGNGQVGDTVDRFWFDGPLTISAIKQVQFLRQFALRRLGSQALITAIATALSARQPTERVWSQLNSRSVARHSWGYTSTHLLRRFQGT